MEPSAGGSTDRRGARAGAGAAPSGLHHYGLSFFASSLLQALLAVLLEYSGIVPSGPAPQTPQPVVPSSSSSEADGLLSAATAGDGEVLIRIQGALATQTRRAWRSHRRTTGGDADSQAASQGVPAKPGARARPCAGGGKPGGARAGTGHTAPAAGCGAEPGVVGGGAMEQEKRK